MGSWKPPTSEREQVFLQAPLEPSSSLYPEPLAWEILSTEGRRPTTLTPMSLYLLQAMAGGAYGPTWAQVLFSLQDLKQIKTELEKFSDDPDKY